MQTDPFSNINVEELLEDTPKPSSSEVMSTLHIRVSSFSLTNQKDKIVRLTKMMLPTATIDFIKRKTDDDIDDMSFTAAVTADFTAYSYITLTEYMYSAICSVKRGDDVKIFIYESYGLNFYANLNENFAFELTIGDAILFGNIIKSLKKSSNLSNGKFIRPILNKTWFETKTIRQFVDNALVVAYTNKRFIQNGVYRLFKNREKNCSLKKLSDNAIVYANKVDENYNGLMAFSETSQEVQKKFRDYIMKNLDKIRLKTLTVMASDDREYDTYKYIVYSPAYMACPGTDEYYFVTIIDKISIDEFREFVVGTYNK